MTKATAKVKAKAPTPVRRMKTKDIDELVSRLETMDIGEDYEDVSEPVTPFRFFDLPYELRLRVYELLLVFPKTIDLDPSNSRAIVPYLRMLLTCRRMHDEASRVFYSLNTFRIFPVHGRFIHAKAPLLARLPSAYRSHITRLELRLGPSWTKPPRGWVVDSRLGLANAQKVHFLKVFVECDPESNAYFEGFGGDGNDGSDGFYTMFCLGLMQRLFAQLEGLNKVEFDAYPGLPKTSPLLHSLVDAAKAGNKRILWGPERGWDKIVEVDLANVLQKMGLGAL